MKYCTEMKYSIRCVGVFTPYNRTNNGSMEAKEEPENGTFNSQEKKYPPHPPTHSMFLHHTEKNLPLALVHGTILGHLIHYHHSQYSRTRKHIHSLTFIIGVVVFFISFHFGFLF